MHEIVEQGRLRPAYVCQRRFCSGQIRAQTCLMLDRPRPLELAQWMAVGLVQFFGWGLATALLLASRSPLAVRAASGACAGLGKLLWMRPFQLALYRKPERVAAAGDA